ncbi:MAG: N-6 DNA methylase [Alphaproteobacteria bacterium]|nr:N-6 DNA methylase [Alphaproteobacteria bacterium]
MVEQVSLSESDGLIIQTISFDEAAQCSKTSVATIRNWVKTGQLKQIDKGLIDKVSFDYFQEHIAGKEKLTLRANKSLKDSHNHNDLSKQILQKITHKNMCHLSDDYEQALSDSYKNKEGIYYTAETIISDMLTYIADLENKTFLDPCCGSGNFIMGAIQKGFAAESIHGFDIDPIAVAITKERIYQKTGYVSNNIHHLNFLEHVNDIQQGFDYIFTNPPWGKKLTVQEKINYATIFNAGKSCDTSALFLFAALRCLNKNGMIGFLLPEAFFNIAVFQDARMLALQKQIVALIDYGKAFDGLLTKAQGIILENAPFKQQHQVICKNKNQTNMRYQHSFIKMPKAIFNFHCSAQEIIDRAYSLPHITLTNCADWGLGIVTGNNKKFLDSVAKPDDIPVFKGADITHNGLRAPSCYIPKDFSLYQQVAPLELYQAKEKIIYKFISSKLCFYCDNQQRFILNSANMLILRKNFPISATQLVDLLNSDIINWLFQNIFNSHKILRKDIEALPIHVDFFQNNTIFNEEKYLSYLQIERIGDRTYRLKK